MHLLRNFWTKKQHTNKCFLCLDFITKIAERIHTNRKLKNNWLFYMRVIFCKKFSPSDNAVQKHGNLQESEFSKACIFSSSLNLQECINVDGMTNSREVGITKHYFFSIVRMENTAEIQCWMSQLCIWT